ncbi:MAG: 50S ribosomal protein L9 [Myxococcales bacterium]|nr:50S ribosomal protein L9 [Myxococcales bacterium]MCZ6713616.1 50S ribosomal protein L9 [Deltaproteobacteria bacterium]MCZ6822403.1 50S ribosomal protein L9 [Deltaproteobacteria bacterium]TDJ02222.1 MAG: 50S ribosomal protein L9 [Deltaproteobacteria bacterium]TDJ05475.1 MAG: 50S ribosomal protein L9 [Deltaproteobacteria bacterium]
MAVEVILTEDISTLGNAGEVVRVRPGYARNYLLPQGKAMLATKGRVRELEHKRRVIEEKIRKEVGGHELVAKRLEQTELEFQVLVGAEGKLFGSITNADIAGRLGEQGIELDRRKIELSEPIKQLGEYKVTLKLHREVSTQIRVKVVASD